MCPDTTPPHVLEETALSASRPASLAPSKNTAAPAARRWGSFRRGGQGERCNDAEEIIKEGEAFRMGLQRNVLHLSNVIRSNQTELTSLREQLETKNAQLAALRAEAAKQATNAQDMPASEPGVLTLAGKGKSLQRYGNLAVVVSRIAAGCRQTSKACVVEKTDIGSSEDNGLAAAIVALGEKQTKEKLLKANRDLRSQLARSFKETEAFRLASVRVDVLGKDKAELQERIDHMADQLKLQAAPLTALQLDVTQARVETEAMRARLKEERRESRLRYEASERDRSKLSELAEGLNVSLDEALRTSQRETAKATKYEGLYTEAATKNTRLQQELVQSKADARRIAQELVRLQGESDGPMSLRRVYTAAGEGGTLGGTQASSASDVIDRDRSRKIATPLGEGMEAMIKDLREQVTQTQEKAEKAEGAHKAETEKSEAERERVEEDNDATIARLREDVVALTKAKQVAEGRRDELSRLAREQAEEREEEHARVLTALEERADEAEQESSRLRVLVEQTRKGPASAPQRQQKQSIRAELCRTVDELSSAEEATEMALTCLKCTQLFRNPQVMAPCGHTLCGDCCDCTDGTAAGGVDELKRALANDVNEKNSKGLSQRCFLCREERDSKVGVDLLERPRGVAPNRAVAALLGNFTFRRQCVEALKRISLLLWQEGLAAGS